MKARLLKKLNKKAAAILIGALGYPADSFGADDDDGLTYFSWRCSYEYDEWDSKTAHDEWLDQRGYAHPNFERWYGFDPDTGEPIPEDQRPRPMGHREARVFFKLVPPPGYRWRGRRVIKAEAGKVGS